MRVSRYEVFIQIIYKGGLMQHYKLFSKYLIHYGNVRRMCPVGVVYSRIGDALLLALNGSHHHVCGVNRVDEIWRECRFLLGLGDWLVIEVICHRYLLEDGVDDALRTDCFIGLNAGKAKR